MKKIIVTLIGSFIVVTLLFWLNFDYFNSYLKLGKTGRVIKVLEANDLSYHRFQITKGGIFTFDDRPEEVEALNVMGETEDYTPFQAHIQISNHFHEHDPRYGIIYILEKPTKEIYQNGSIYVGGKFRIYFDETVMKINHQEVSLYDESFSKEFDGEFKKLNLNESSI